MTKTAIISTVGASLFTNYIEYCAENEHLKLPSIKSELKQIEKLTAEELDKKGKEEKEKIEKVIKVYWLKDDSSCAETHSIKKYLEDNPIKLEKVVLYFVATDTAQSLLSAKLIINFFKNKGYEADGFTVEDLFIKKSFSKEGYSNLFQAFEEVENDDEYKKTVYNISGGYKALIPFITI